MLRRVIQDERRQSRSIALRGGPGWRARRAGCGASSASSSSTWTPVGAGVKSQEEVDALALYLFGCDEQGASSR